jgi:large subunit ribosomal protein L9
MDVILLERIEKLGQMGDVVKVKPGFARNYLLPQKKALRATEANKARFTQQRAQLEATNLERRQEAEAISGKVDGLKVVLVRQAGETGQLYGSVSPRDIAEAVSAAGVSVERRQILMDRPIKMLGLHPVRVALHPEVIVTVTANVAKSAEEAEAQEKAGGYVGRAEEVDEPDIDALLATVEPVATEAPPAESA